jgi:hypothetical protein
MKRILAKHISVRLDVTSYAALRVQILARDGWKCQNVAVKITLRFITRNSAVTVGRIGRII